jgi:hypothetical protein
MEAILSLGRLLLVHVAPRGPTRRYPAQLGSKLFRKREQASRRPRRLRTDKERRAPCNEGEHLELKLISLKELSFV